MKKFPRNVFVPAFLAASGTPISVNTDKLPKSEWKTHSGRAPVAQEDVHSLQSQKIAGTKNILLRAESGKQFCVTDGEAERFCADHLVSLGYTVKAPTI